MVFLGIIVGIILFIMILIGKVIPFIYYLFFFTFYGSLICLILGYSKPSSDKDDENGLAMLGKLIIPYPILILFISIFYQEVIGSTIGQLLSLIGVDIAFGVDFKIVYSKFFWPW